MDEEGKFAAADVASPTTAAKAPLDAALAPTLDGKQTPPGPALVSPKSQADRRAELALIAVPGAVPAPLQTWDHYEILRPLGQGGMGTVFLARDRRLGRQVALKFLRVPSPEAAERLLQEARAQARLDHNGICKVFDVGEFLGQPYIAMEYIDGQPLHLLLGRLRLEQKVLLLQQITQAVHAAHGQGILHRDLKPANVMVCEGATGDGTLRPVLMDFGLARDSMGPQRLTQTGMVMGTPHYMAPEQARGQARHLDRRADVYSLGAVLYEMLAGKPPFDADNEVDLMLAVLHQDPIPPRRIDSNVPPDLEIIALKCLAKEPGQRYDSALALAEDLGRYLRGEPIVARPASTLYRLRRLAARHRTIVAALFMVLIFLGGFLETGRRARAEQRRTAERAQEREKLAAQLGQTVTEMKLFLRVAYSLPPHDLRREEALVRQRLQKLQAESDSAERFLQGTMESALGQGYLALREYEPAIAHLQRALALGEQAPSVHLALGQALGRRYEQRIKILRQTKPLEQAKVELAALETELLVPARREIALGRSTELVSASYIEALLRFYKGETEYEQALQLAHKAQEETPWHIEPLALEVQIANERFQTHVRRGAAQVKESEKQVRAALERAMGTARSYPDFYAEFLEMTIVSLRNAMFSGVLIKEIEPNFLAAVNAGNTLRMLVPDGSQALDLLAGCYARWSYSSELQHVDPRPTVKFGLAVAAAALAIPPRRSAPHAARGLMHLAQAEYSDQIGEDSLPDLEQAVLDVKQALEIDPNNTDFWNNLAVNQLRIVEAKRSRGLSADAALEQAIVALRRAVELFPGSLLPMNNLADTYTELGASYSRKGRDPSAQFAASRALIDQIFKQSPDFQDTELTLLGLYRAELEHQLRTGQDAVDAARKHISEAQRLIDKHRNDAQSAMNMARQMGLAMAYPQLGRALFAQKQDPEPAIREGIVQLSQLLRAAQNQVPTHDNVALAQLYLLRARQQQQQGQSGDAAIDAALKLVEHPEQSRASVRIEARLAHAQAARLRAEWMMAHGRGKVALAAVESGLTACATLRNQMQQATPELRAEEGTLMTLKAQLAGTGAARTQLAEQAQQALRQALAEQPPLKAELHRFLQVAEHR